MSFKDYLGPVLTVRVHSPTQGVIGVKLDHVVGGDPRTHIQLFPDDGPVSDVAFSKLDDQTTVLKSGDLTAEIKENPYTITFKSPTRILTESGFKHQALYHVPSVWTTQSASNSSVTAQDPLSNPNPEAPPPVVRYLNSELNISPGELIYGLGEQFGAFVKNGKKDFFLWCIALLKMG